MRLSIIWPIDKEQHAMKPLLKASDEAEFIKRFDAEYSLGTWKGKDVWFWLQTAGIAERPLEPGLYWVRYAHCAKPEVMRYNGDGRWERLGTDATYRLESDSDILCRILPPSQEGTDGK